MNKYKVPTNKYSVRIEDAKINILKKEFEEDSITKIIERLIDEKLGEIIKPPKRIKSPIMRIGGKYIIASKLVALMPKHRIYVDVFGGAFHVLFAKPKELSKIEIINDKLSDLINFFKVIKDQPFELREKIMKMPKSRVYYEELKKLEYTDPLEKAYQFFYLIRNSRFGNLASGFDISIGNNYSTTINRIADEIPYISERLKNTDLECSTWQHMLKRYGKYEDTFLFIDPPYIIENKKDGLYELPFDIRDTRELAKRLNELPCKIMVTHYDNKLYEKYFEGWRTERITVHKSSGATQTIEVIDENGNTSIKTTKPTATEVVYMNY